MSKELVKKEANLPAVLDFTADSGAGFEEADQQSYAIPFLQILQSGSPQCKKSEGAYIKGASEGMLFNTVTEQLFDGEKGVLVIPCHFTRQYNEWAPRDSGGGFRGSHDVADGTELLTKATKGPKGEDVLPNGNILNDTRNHYVLIVKEDGTTEPALLSLGSTQIKKSKRWMTMMQNLRMPGGNTFPMYSQIYRLMTTPESNDKGSWMGLKVEHVGTVQTQEQYTSAKQFRELVRSGATNAAPPTDNEFDY